MAALVQPCNIVCIVLASVLISWANAHGFCSIPRTRGALFTQRPVGNLASEQQVRNKWTYCPHCRNGGGTDRLKGIAGNVVNDRFVPFKPMKGMFRNGVSLCGDPDGSNDFSASGKYGAPNFMPFVAEYQAGGTVDFEYDITTPHGGYLQYFLCDISGENDISRNSFTSGKCHLLERAREDACESGNDKECGPIDPKHPSRWYLPCRVSDARDQDQIVGGKGGKMKYKLPGVAMSKAVILSYWLTGNNCNADGLKEYFTSGKWKAVENSKCPGDGGTAGGFREDHTGTCTTQAGKFPEEFWNCADVKINGGGGGNNGPKVMPNQGSDDNMDDEQDDSEKDDNGGGKNGQQNNNGGDDDEYEGGDKGDGDGNGQNGGDGGNGGSGGNTNSGSGGDGGGSGGDNDNGDDNNNVTNGGNRNDRGGQRSGSNGNGGGGWGSSWGNRPRSGGNGGNGGWGGRRNRWWRRSHHNNGWKNGMFLEADGNNGNGKSQSGGSSEGDLRPGCMPPVDPARMNDPGYQSYLEQLRSHCRRN